MSRIPLAVGLAVVLLVTIFNYAPTFAQENEARQPDQLAEIINNAKVKTQRQAIQLAAKPMFNNANDWQRWANQVNQLRPNQLNGLMNILNVQQRQMLAQQQNWVSQWVRHQWMQQQLWMQQNALRTSPLACSLEDSINHASTTHRSCSGIRKEYNLMQCCYQS